jgi:hypothetical protein
VGLVVGGETPTPAQVPETPPQAGGLGLEAVLGGAVVVLIVVYIALYWRGMTTAETYSSGFVVERCPVCQRGHMIVEVRQERLLGIPRPRRIVRCDECRSVLRETTSRRWRYAVDPIENPDLYRRYNGRELDEQSLIDMARLFPQRRDNLTPHSPAAPPDFIDDDQ